MNVGKLGVRRLRSSEWMLIAYFTYVALIAPWFISAWRAWAMAAFVAAVVWGLAHTRSLARDIAPVVLALMAYREMNWFSSATHDHHLERSWIIWDRRLLDALHLRALIEGGGALLPSFLELCYLLVYVVGLLSVLVLLVNHRRHRIDEFMLAYLAGTLGAYGMFPYFPSDPPRVVFPGADLPNIVTGVRQFNLWIVDGYGIHSSVFPSAHVSLAFSAAWGLLATIPERPWIGWLMAAYAFSVAVAAVYGRYHYGVDVVPGMAVSLLAIAALKLRSVYIG